METKKYKQLYENLLEDYLLVKKKAISLGYDDKCFNFKDYVETYIKIELSNDPK